MDIDRMAYEKQALAVLDSIYRLALWLAPREADARDLVQETYLRALEAREAFRPGASMRAWLARILRNRFIDLLRQSGREVPWPTSAGEPKVLEIAGDGEPGLFGDAEMGRLTSLVRGDIGRALQSLPENHRTVVLLCDVEQWLWEEAADVLQVPRKPGSGPTSQAARPAPASSPPRSSSRAGSAKSCLGQPRPPS